MLGSKTLTLGPRSTGGWVGRAAAAPTGANPGDADPGDADPRDAEADTGPSEKASTVRTASTAPEGNHHVVGLRMVEPWQSGTTSTRERSQETGGAPTPPRSDAARHRAADENRGSLRSVPEPIEERQEPSRSARMSLTRIHNL